MGNLIIDAQVKKDIRIFDLDQDKHYVSFVGKRSQFRREIEFLDQLIKFRNDGVYPHLIINYHNTYKYSDSSSISIFKGCLPVKIYKEGKNTILKMIFNSKEKVDQEYLDFYTEEFDKEMKNGRK